METLDQKKRRFYGKRHLTAYIGELDKLTIGSLDLNDIMSLVKTDEISKGFKGDKIYFGNMFFKDKSKLSVVIKSILAVEQGPFYLFTSFSPYCGALKLESISKFNVEFNFNDEHAGIISLIDDKLNIKVVLDFYEEMENEYLEIEIYSNFKNSMINDLLMAI